MAANNVFSAVMDALSITDKIINSGKLAGNDLVRAQAVKSSLAGIKPTAYALREYKATSDNIDTEMSTT